MDRQPDFDGFHVLSVDPPSYPYASYASIVKLGFQFSKPPPSSDISRLGCAAHFDLSAMDLLPPMNGRGLPSAPSRRPVLDSDHDDDLPSVKQILTSSKRAKQVVDLTGDDDDDREGDDG